eukprot:CAMPEP_0172554900 /NCGR_PEP_ID=MMETSP1067-20121228/56936_1 /TAXON_ID=265564 ORGANISM="Thalassiosira punctigera, Strain Tpunct2005C2" /NCGR_SAMPLE_ID=MMETSP1067 /ASSEMBLY_ACC=CAM_ASM_000444 /LENGTH=89 /DNA_ID=CAMNT_0013343363 /DNA_START=56 /DNA_END=325 /DNA_ORIENTATION=-
MTASPPLLDKLTAPPIVVTNPEVIKYLVCQLFTEAILVLTLVLLVPSILWEEWRHHSKNRQLRNRKKRVKGYVEEEAKTGGGGDGGGAS